MIEEIRVPKLGMTQDRITVVEWTRSDGETVQKDETVVIIETAKVSYDVPAPASGLVFRLCETKSKVKIGDVLGVVADSREAFEKYGRPKTPAASAATAAPDSSPPAEDDLFGADEPEPSSGVKLVFGDESPAPAASSTAATAWAAPPPQAAIDLTGRKIKNRRPMVGMRQTIADNLMYSLHSTAQLTVVAEADLTELAAFRRELKLDRPELKITFVDLLVKLLPTALAEYPIINSAVVDDEIVCWDECNIGVAVALEEGLVVPVVRDADRKSLAAVSREIKKLAQKARSGELAPEDYRGGTFTLSSGGAVAIEFVTPILNPPENAILGLGRIGPKPAVHNGELAIRTMTYLCLTHDHRVIDGVPAALFLGRYKELIETPALFKKILR